MRKKLNLWLIILIGIMTWACADGDDQQDIIVDIGNIETSVIETSSVVTKELARKVVDRFHLNSNSTRLRNQQNVEIQEVRLINDEIGNPSFYVVNYANNEGFVIVSATQKYIPILAYSDQGNFDVENIDRSSVLYWVQVQKQTTQEIDAIPDSLKIQFKLMWSDYNMDEDQSLKILKERNSSDIQNLIHSSVNQWRQQGYEVYTMSEFIHSNDFRNFSPAEQNEITRGLERYANRNYGDIYNNSFMLKKYESINRGQASLLKTKWGQQNGFNQFTPNNYPVGCVAVAAAQIMKFHQYPTSFKWGEMQDLYATSTTAQFLKDVGTAVKMDYGSKGSSSNINNALSALKNTYGYKNARKVDHNHSDVFNQLEMKRPVYMRGYDSSGLLGLKQSGHAWVCDGFSLFSNTYTWDVKCIENTPSNITPKKFSIAYTNAKVEQAAYFRMNWGWNGSHDGMYYYTDVNTPLNNGNFAHGRENIIDIYPVK